MVLIRLIIGGLIALFGVVFVITGLVSGPKWIVLLGIMVLLGAGRVILGRRE